MYQSWLENKCWIIWVRNQDNGKCKNDFLSVCSSHFTRKKGLCLVKANETMEVGGRTPCYQFRKPIQTCPNEHKESLVELILKVNSISVFWSSFYPLAWPRPLQSKYESGCFGLCWYYFPYQRVFYTTNREFLSKLLKFQKKFVNQSLEEIISGY